MYRETFPQRLKKAREETGLSQTDVAKELGIGQSTLARYEVGQREPDLETLGTLADFFDISIDWLLGTGKKYNNETQKNRIIEAKSKKEILKDLEKSARTSKKRMVK